jgi:hypothetical protein
MLRIEVEDSHLKKPQQIINEKAFTPTKDIAPFSPNFSQSPNSNYASILQPSSPTVRSCKHCSYSFYAITSNLLDFCTKDCQTSFILASQGIMARPNATDAKFPMQYFTPPNTTQVVDSTNKERPETSLAAPDNMKKGILRVNSRGNIYFADSSSCTAVNTSKQTQNHHIH